MAEQRQIPTVTILEETPPSLEIITLYEELVDKPHILQAFIASEAKVSLGVSFLHGEQGIVMKNYPTLIDVDIVNSGELDLFAEDPENYFFDSNGDLNYFDPLSTWLPSDISTLQWWVDFGHLPSLTLGGGNEISAISNRAGATSGSWTNTGTNRPTLNNGVAEFVKANSQSLVASFVETSTQGHIFIVVESAQDVYYISGGNTGVADGDHIAFGMSNNVRPTMRRRQTGTGQGTEIYTLKSDLNKFNLLSWSKNSGNVIDIFFNGLTEVKKTSTTNEWFDVGTANQTAMGKLIALSSTFYDVKIKEILFFNQDLSIVDRLCMEAYLKFKHALPVYDQTFLLAA